LSCWGRSESGVDDGGGVVGSSAVWLYCIGMVFVMVLQVSDEANDPAGS